MTTPQANPDSIARLLEICETRDGPDVHKRHRDAQFLQALGNTATDSLVKLRGLALAYAHYEQLLVELEALTLTVKDQFQNLATSVIPDIMDRLGIDNLSISETQSIAVKEKVGGNVPKDVLPLFIKWLKKNGHGAIVKHDVTTSFGTNQQELAAKVIAAISEAGGEPEVKEHVNHQTLQAWVRTELENGRELPDTLKVWRQRSAVIKEK